MLKNISDDSYTVHVIYCDSSLLNMFVYDKLKECCEAGLESVLEVTNTSSFNDMLDLMNIQPFLSKRWLFSISYKKVKKLVEKYKGLFSSLSSGTSCFMIKVENYKEFLEVKSLIPQRRNDLYLSYMNFSDVAYLLKGYDISDAVLNYIAKSYSREPDKIMLLVEKLNLGVSVPDRKTVVSICGESQSTVQSYVMSLLSVKVKSEIGAKMSLKRKINDGVGLCREYSPGTVRNYMISALRDMIHVKQMYLNSDIYKEIRSVPDCFSDSKLERYRVYLNQIIEIPIDKMIRLFIALQKSGRWYKEVDLISFFFFYYEVQKN